MRIKSVDVDLRGFGGTTKCHGTEKNLTSKGTLSLGPHFLSNSLSRM